MTTAMVVQSQTGTIAIGSNFRDIRSSLVEKLLDSEPENHGKWQQLDVSESPAHATHELLNVSVWYEMPKNINQLEADIPADLYWAEGHFRERVAGKPVNPGEWHDKWPYHAGAVELHQNGGRYDHNYMERFWPKTLERENSAFGDWDGSFTGYRFPVGDLNDVVAQLRRDRGTRQAYLPVWFPEDTGAAQGQRVPCTLGYHFIVRDNVLHCTYNMRSCEAYRHFTNDTYMAVRLAEWVAYSVSGDIRLGQLTMNIVSFHGFVGDTEQLEGLI